MLPFLKGIRILDITAVILGPYATQTLGDLGAEVIKIEPLEGESMRPVPPMVDGVSALVANNNRNKRSLALDLKSKEGVQVVKRLIPTADVIVHNMRQDSMDRLGLSFEEAKALNPKILYCAAVGFGADGPYAGRPAYDDIIQSASGLAGLFGMRDGTPAITPSIIADKITGLTVVYAVLAALVDRERNGAKAMYVEVPMFETMVAFFLNEHMAAATFEDDGEMGYFRVLAKDRRPFQTKDGWIGVLPYSKENWANALDIIGRADVKGPWFENATERARRMPELYGILASELPGKTSTEWLDAFQKADIPCARVNTPKELLENPHLQAVGMFTPNFTGETPAKRTLRFPVGYRGVARSPDRPAPRLGEHNHAILTELGYDKDAIARLSNRREGV
jgi:crotonobetainyl-CoA:carnitine CoA-transferase CaiB-like acyl-CoA transferase